MPLELCVLIVSHFLALSWTCLSYFLDYVDKDIKYVFKNIGVSDSVLHKVRKSADQISVGTIQFTLPELLYMCSWIRLGHKITIWTRLWHPKQSQIRVYTSANGSARPWSLYCFSRQVTGLLTQKSYFLWPNYSWWPYGCMEWPDVNQNENGLIWKVEVWLESNLVYGYK